MNVVPADRQGRFDASVDGVALLDEFIEAFGHDRGVPDRLTFRARVCAAELAANALEHGGAVAGQDRIVLELSASENGQLSMRYSDTSAAFDPTFKDDPRRVPKEGSLGGRGLKLLDSLPTRSRYSRERDCNVVELLFL